MTTRERHLAAIVGGVIGVGALGFVAYSFVLGPLFDKEKQIQARSSEVDQLNLDIMTVLAEKKKFESARIQSLPADVGMSRLQYSSLLEGLIRRADFAPGSYKITPAAEADTKSAPNIAPKKPAYSKLTFELSLKGQLYNVVDFMQLFYHQPLLHSIKKLNVQRPSDARAAQTRQLDATMTIEALVLDNAQARPTLLPLASPLALLSGAAAQTGYNLFSVSGRGSPVPPPGILADDPRQYLAIAGKDMFFGPPPKGPKGPLGPLTEEDHSPFVTLTSVVGEDDGTIIAVFRDKLDNHNYTIKQSPKGAIEVKGEYEIGGKPKIVPGYSEKNPGRVIFFGSVEGGNLREWRVRRVLLDAVIMEKIEAADPESETTPKPHPLGAIGGGLGALVAVPEIGKVFRVNVGQDLETDPKDTKSDKRSAPPPSKLTSREAWKEIYAPLVLPTVAGSGGK
jgi:hypothetical protein